MTFGDIRFVVGLMFAMTVGWLLDSRRGVIVGGLSYMALCNLLLYVVYSSL